MERREFLKSASIPFFAIPVIGKLSKPNDKITLMIVDQNPAEVILHFLAQVMNIPQHQIHLGSFERLAKIYDNMGFGKSGKIILDHQIQDPMDILRDMLMMYNCNLIIDKHGCYTIFHKDISRFLWYPSP